MEFLWEGLLSITWQQAVMYVVGAVLIYLAIEKDYEPSLLLPMGFGAILVNIPSSGALNQFARHPSQLYEAFLEGLVMFVVLWAVSAKPRHRYLVGGLFALTKWWGVLKRYELYAGLVAKMIAFPLAFYALLTALTGALPQLPITHDMVLMITVIAGLPTMTTIAMFTGRKNNMPEYAVGFVLVSTLFSLASLTIVSAVVF